MTKEAKMLIIRLYKEYILRRKDGISITKARVFGSSEDVQRNFFTNVLPDDITEIMRGLGTEGYLQNDYADNIVYRSQLTDKVIEEMENQFKENINNVLEALAKLKAAVPFM